MKTFTTWFFPVVADFQKIVVDWVTFWRSEKRLRPGRPDLPQDACRNGPDTQFHVEGLERAPWCRMARTPCGRL